MLEAGMYERFPGMGNFTSCCCKVQSKWKSNDIKKGKGNSRNGDNYPA
jgi:hypothetical protein